MSFQRERSLGPMTPCSMWRGRQRGQRKGPLPGAKGSGVLSSEAGDSIFRISLKSSPERQGKRRGQSEGKQHTVLMPPALGFLHPGGQQQQREGQGAARCCCRGAVSL